VYANESYFFRWHVVSDIDDSFSENVAPNWTVTELFAELETVPSFNAVISYLQTNFVYINDTKNKLVAP